MLVGFYRCWGRVYCGSSLIYPRWLQTCLQVTDLGLYEVACNWTRVSSLCFAGKILVPSIAEVMLLPYLVLKKRR